MICLYARDINANVKGKDIDQSHLMIKERRLQRRLVRYVQNQHQECRRLPHLWYASLPGTSRKDYMQKDHHTDINKVNNFLLANLFYYRKKYVNPVKAMDIADLLMQLVLNQRFLNRKRYKLLN